MTECIQNEFEFQGLNSRTIVGKFDGGTITSDAGGLLLREVEKKTGIIKTFVEGFIDYRDKSAIEHTVKELVSQRIYGIALGYEDLNDHDELRRDPLMAVLSDKKDPQGNDRKRKRDKGNALAGKSTLNRLELTKEETAQTDRYKKIVYAGAKIEELFVRVFLASRKEEPEKIILDLDTTDDRIHGTQEGRYYHGYYGDYCYLPLYIFCGEDLLCAKLNTSDKGAGKDAVEEVRRIVKQIRQQWPHTHIILRGDSDFSKDDLMRWTEAEERVDYIFGLRKNARLLVEIKNEMIEAERLYKEAGEKQRRFRDFMYETLNNTWARPRRIIGKAEHLEKGANPRLIVTSLSAEEYADPQRLYEKDYCGRGDMENRIKEQQLYLFSDRTSTHELRSNQLRLWFSSVAYMLIVALRRYAQDTGFEKAQAETLRNKLLKIGAQVYITVRRIVVSFASGYPYQNIFQRIYERLHGPLLYTPA